jgi:hypothetical protein
MLFTMVFSRMSANTSHALVTGSLFSIDPTHELREKRRQFLVEHIPDCATHSPGTTEQ